MYLNRQIKEGDKYHKLNPVICINILDYNLFKESTKAHICFVIKEKDRNIVYGDHFSIHYIELPKVTKHGKYGKLYKWLHYLKFEGTKDKELMDFIQNDPDIKRAHEQYEEFLSDEQLQNLYLAREMYQHDEATRIAVAEDRKAIQIAKVLKQQGVSFSIIAESTGLSKKNIKELQVIQKKQAE